MLIAFHSPYSVDSNNLSILLDEAMEYLQDPSNTVAFVSCAGQICPCDINYERSWIRCQECILCSHLILDRIKHPNFIRKSIGDFVSQEKVAEIRSMKFEYESIESVKQITYRECNIGLGVVSSYITRTRNLNASLNKTTRCFIDQLLGSSAILAESTFNLIDSLQPDSLCLVNGRFCGYRSFLEVGMMRKIRTTVLELTISTTLEAMRKVKFENCLPHDIDNTSACIEQNWNEYPNPCDKEKLAANFFVRRRNAQFASDTVYIGDQDPNMLPPNWDVRKRNFVIFNSSEDEFFAVGESFDKYKIFYDQIEGIQYLVEKTAHDPSIHYYLRIHPNLKNVNYKYHTGLKDKYCNCSNVTVIPADSPISTYRLIESCEKVIVFGSTVGVEATYWGKPVILLAGALYMHLDVVYYPQRLEELDDLLFSQLDAKPRLGALKYALYIFGERGAPYAHVNFNCRKFSFGKYTVMLERCFEYRNSMFPYLMLKAFFRLLNLPERLYFKRVIMPKLALEE